MIGIQNVHTSNASTTVDICTLMTKSTLQLDLLSTFTDVERMFIFVLKLLETVKISTSNTFVNCISENLILVSHKREVRTLIKVKKLSSLPFN